MPTFELWEENNEGGQKSSSLSALLLSSGGRWRPESRMIYEWDSISFLFALLAALHFREVIEATESKWLEDILYLEKYFP